ncbi:hypothetical protein DFH09DRAFT_20485 [Mycena vulgaris]|nr:hypothetical protein DFH09DRAFT_20485 [Mycena vulgaris]
MSCWYVSLYHYGASCYSPLLSRAHPVSDNPKTGKSASLVAKDTYEVVVANAATLDTAIIYNRDFSDKYFGFKTLERPQHLIMCVAVGNDDADVRAGRHRVPAPADGHGDGVPHRRRCRRGQCNTRGVQHFLDERMLHELRWTSVAAHKVMPLCRCRGSAAACYRRHCSMSAAAVPRGGTWLQSRRSSRSVAAEVVQRSLFSPSSC